MRSGFRLAAVWPALIALPVAAGLLWVFLPGLLQRSVSSTLTDFLPVLEPEVRRHLGESGPALQDWVSRAAARSQLRITIIRDDGTVLADSARTWEQVGFMDDHSTRPEIREARTRGTGVAVRRSATTGVRYAYAARQLESADGGRYFLRLAEPLRDLAALRTSLARIVGVAVVVALAVVALVWAWLDRRLYRPLDELISGANRIAAGDLEHRLPVPEAEELATVAKALNRLAAGVTHQMSKAEAERSHLQQVLASMADGVLVVDRRGRILSANPAFRGLFELEGEVVGRSPMELTRRIEIAELIEETLARGEGLRRELDMDREGGRLLSLTSAALEGREGAVVVARDITDFVRLSEIRRDLVANVSHELKTPLTAIRGYAETLESGAIEEPQTAREFTERILRQCVRLELLLKDLLTLSRLESPRSMAEWREVDLHGLVERAVEVVRHTAVDKEVTIQVEGDAPPVKGDADSLEQLIINLLDNAVKYNRRGGWVWVRLADLGGEVALEVADSGIGIPPSALTRVFERFYRVDKGRSRAEGGTGLGLAIVKHAAQVHGGRVEVRSELGSGSTFRVRLPVAGTAGQADPQRSLWA